VFRRHLNARPTFLKVSDGAWQTRAGGALFGAAESLSPNLLPALHYGTYVSLWQLVSTRLPPRAGGLHFHGRAMALCATTDHHGLISQDKGVDVGLGIGFGIESPRSRSRCFMSSAA